MRFKYLLGVGALVSAAWGCTFNSQSLSESERRLAEREKVIQNYRAIQGVYEGEIKLSERAMPVRVLLGYTEVVAGSDADGRPIFQPRLTARLERPLVLETDISMLGDFEAGASVLTLTGNRAGASGSTSAASEAFYLRAQYQQESFSGDLRFRDQFYGRLSVKRTSLELPANWDTDASGLSEREKAKAAYRKIQGVYVGEVQFANGQTTPIQLFVGYTEITGEGQDGRPQPKPRLSVRMNRPSLLVPDVSLMGEFRPFERVMTVIENSTPGAPGAGSGGLNPPGAPGSAGSEGFYFQGWISEGEPLEIQGELRVRDQSYGRVSLRRQSEELPSAADLDELLVNQYLTLLRPLEGRYQAFHQTDRLDEISQFEIRVITANGRLPALTISYRRNEFTLGTTTALTYRPGFTPPRISFAVSVNVPNGQILIALDALLEQDGTIRGQLTHGLLTGELVAKKRP